MELRIRLDYLLFIIFMIVFCLLSWFGGYIYADEKWKGVLQVGHDQMISEKEPIRMIKK